MSDTFNNEVEKIYPQGDNVLLQIIEQTVTKGGIIIPDKARGNQRDAIYAQVMAIGEGRTTEYGALIKCTVRPGEYVLIARGSGVAVEHEKCQLRLLRDCEILCRIEESRIVTLGLVQGPTGGIVTP